MGRKEGCKMLRHTNRPVNDQWADFGEWLAVLTLHLGHHRHEDYAIVSQKDMGLSCINLH
jgi:hypothetical protein